MLAVWYLDRASGLTAYFLLWLAVFTGIFYNATSFEGAYRASNRLHTPVSWLSAAALALHVAVGTLDSAFVLLHTVPQPAYSYAYFVVGDLVGAGGLVLVVVSILAFVDPKRFKRPWDPKVVHAFAYGGFLFATYHAVALGTDLTGFAVLGVLGGTLFLLYVLILRFVGERGRAKRTRPRASASFTRAR
ncbi:MAG: hypothetical protein ACYDCK_06305 [Thermoplasmatota archaeon]